MNEELQELQKEIVRLRELDEFNENMYKQRFIQLKKSFSDALLKKIGLELLGLEDIADMSEEPIKHKLQRRIDNIHKIIYAAKEE